LRIAHISDIQTDGLNEMHWRAKKASDAFDPHLVLFTGDLVNHKSLLPEVEQYLRSFKRRNAAILVGGNCDRVLDLEEVARAAGYEDIEERSVQLQIEGSTIRIAGLDAGAQLIAGSNRERNPEDLVLWLSHRPDAGFLLQNETVDLLFSGHTHGGQACLPLFGPVITFSSVPRPIAAGGLHKIGNVPVIVNRGLGWEGHVAPRLRLFCRPQIILLEIVPLQL
jgi:predicted MPP superfamily phosphohydrolase